MEVNLPEVCPKCQNPNSNIVGSVYGEYQHYRISCMQCGYVYKIIIGDAMAITEP